MRQHGAGPAVPGPVLGLTATAVSSSQINLAWNSIPTAQTYTIRRDGVQIVNQLASTTFQDAALSASTTYGYKVSGVNGFGEGLPSAIASATTQAGTNVFPPNAPAITNLTASGTADPTRQLSCTHTLVANTDHYAVQYRFTGTNTWFRDTALDHTGAQITLANLFSSQSHDVQIGACNLGETVPILWSLTAVASTQGAAGTGVYPATFGFWREDSTIIRNGHTTPDLQSAMASDSTAIGFLCDISWWIMEPSQGNYVRTYTDPVINAMRAIGKQTMFNVWPAAIASNSSFPSASLPTYLQGTGFDPLGVGYIGTLSGPFAKIWLRPNMDRWIAAIIGSLGPYDGTSGFEGIMLPETAWNMNSPSDGTFGEDALIDQYIYMIPKLRAAFPRSRLCARYNYSQTIPKLQQLAAVCKQYGIGVGTTDCYTQQTAMDAILQGTTGGIDYRDQIAMTPCSEFFYSGVSATTITNFAVNPYKARYFFVSHGFGWTPGFSDYPAMQAAYNAIKAQWHNARPSTDP